MAKKEIIIQEEIDRINGIMKNARLISEGFYLEDDDVPVPDDGTFDDSDIPVEEPQEVQQPAPAPEENEDPTKSLGGDFVNKIRAITLDGMKQLNNPPEDPRFQALLKIFNICNKAVDEQKDQQQQPQKPAM